MKKNVFFLTIDGLRADKFEGNDKKEVTLVSGFHVLMEQHYHLMQYLPQNFHLEQERELKKFTWTVLIIYMY